MTDEEREFDMIIAGLEFEPEVIEVPDMGKMSKLELLQERHRVMEILADHKALIDPKTDGDKDLQGYYFGLTAELRRRNML